MSEPSVPPWDDVDAWRRLMAAAEELEGKRALVVRRIKVAGGRVDGLKFVLPVDIRPCLGLAELRAYAGVAGLAEQAQQSEEP